ncbi:MAG: BTAD domain-containing putative transcriptional regulator [Acidimicrobiales bacterium]
MGLALGTQVYVVQPGDCLSVIAERHLGDWRRDQEIDALNRGRLQPDGRTLVDDHWIYPGWILVMPADAVDTQTVGAEVLSPAIAPVAAPDVVTPDPETSPAVQADHAALPLGPSASARVRHSESDHGARKDAEAALTALAAGAFVWGLRRRRREAMHDRPSGRAIRRNRPSVEQADAHARSVAQEDTVRWVDAGLRYLGRALLEREESKVPSIAMVRGAPEGMEVMVSPPDLSPPRHFEAIEGGAIWVLDPTLDLAEIEQLASPCWPFLPALVSLGEAPGGTVLVNLEHAGALGLEGDPDRVAGLMAQMALELRTQPWAEEMLASLDLVGRPFPASAGGSELPAVIESASRVAGRYQAELAPAPSVAIRRAGACQWLPAVALLGEGVPPADRARLAALACPDRSGVAVVGWGPMPEAPWRMAISPEGAATLSGLLDGRPFEMQLRVTANADQIALLEEALRAPLGESRPAGPEQSGGGGQSGGAEQSGGGEWLGDGDIDPELVVDAEQLGELEDWMAGAAECESEDWGEVSMDAVPPGGRSVGFRAGAPAVIDLRVDTVEPGPPPAAPPVELRVLGPVELAGGPVPEPVPASRRASALAVICYLATRSRPVSADQIASALWPADTSKDNFGEPRRKTVMNVISRARLLLGESTVSSSRLLLTDRGYVLSEEVACDWSRFQGLVDERGGSPSEVAARLKEALELVEGEPFAGSLSRPFYEWVSAEHLDLAITARVVDAAESLGRVSLELEDLATAEWAVHQGLQLDPAREELFQVWMHIAGRSGRPDRVEEIYRRLCRALQRHLDAGLSPSEASEAVRSAYCAHPTRV